MITLMRHPGSRIPLSRAEAASALASAGAPASTFEPAIAAHWLGQAGFLFEGGGRRVLVDPYLSDSLGERFRGSPLPHERMMPPPVGPGELRDLDLVLVTHGHGDHLDPGTLPPLAAANPGCRFVVPEACRDEALACGLSAGALVCANAGDRLGPGGIPLWALASAHEDLARDAEGRYLNLGYVFELGGLRIYHSGDCVPYRGLAESLAQLAPDLAFLPVNGRDRERASRGILGNFSLDEAVDLVLKAPIGFGVGHHFGLFGFNTIDVEAARRRLGARAAARDRFALAEAGTMLAFGRG